MYGRFGGTQDRCGLGREVSPLLGFDLRLIYVIKDLFRRTVGLNKAMSKRRFFCLKTPIICNV